MEKVSIPVSVEDAILSLTGIESLMTAKDWERAAIVYAFTANQQGSQSGSRKVVNRLGVKEFADLGIAGLTTQDTVRKYRTIWAEYGTPGIQPGDEVALPNKPFPPTDYRTGNFDDRIQTQVKNAKPEVRREVFKSLASDPDVADDLPTRSEATRQLEAATGRANAQRKRQDDADMAPIRQSFELMRALGAIEDIIQKAAFIGRVWREHAESWAEAERDTFRENWDEATEEIHMTNESVVHGSDWSVAELEA